MIRAVIALIGKSSRFRSAAGDVPYRTGGLRSVPVFLWQAGTASGVTDDFARAQERAADVLRRDPRASAIIESADYEPGFQTLNAGYARLPDEPLWRARRSPGGKVTWQLRMPSPQQAAA
jgi:hypothetical protein